MAAILPSPGQENELDEEAERLRAALGAWARQKSTIFEKRPGNVEECVDRKQTAPFIEKIGLQKGVPERDPLKCEINTDWR
jgi:hypothetical protein